MSTSVLQNLVVPTIKVGGAALDATYYDELLELVVDQTLNALTMVTLRFDDVGLQLLDGNVFALGATVEVSVAGASGQAVTLAKVEVTSIEPEILTVGRSSLLIRCLHKGHRLHYNRLSKTFLKVTDSDLIRAKLGDVGISCTVAATTIKYEHVYQWNQTGMEFVLERARRAGLVYLCEGDTFKFFKPGEAVAGRTLVLGESLSRFAVRTSTGGYTGATTVYGWDPVQKQKIVAEGSAPQAIRSLGDSKFTADADMSSVYAGGSQYVDISLANADAATQAADAYVNAMYEELVDMELEALGDAELKAGSKVDIASVGARFSGCYLITTVRHVFSSGGWLSYVTASGWGARTFADLVGADPGPRRMDGVAVGLVTANNVASQGTEKVGIVKVKFPHYSEEDESCWARLASPMAGAGRGMYVLPEINDEVLVAFEDGDPNRPVVIGALWNGKDATPLKSDVATANGKVEKRIFKTREGHYIQFDDTQGGDSVTIADKKGNKIVFTDEKITITAVKDMDIKVDNGLLAITAKNYTLTATEKITQKSSQASTYEATQDLTLKSSANLKMSSTQNTELAVTASFKLSATAGAELASSTNMKLSANANLELSAMAQFKASGAAMAEVSGGGMLKLGGALINIG